MKCENCINHGICCKWEDKKKGGCTKEPCEDAISRENLLLWLDDIKESARKHVGFLLDVQRYIRSMPSVTPQPRKGHWILTSDDDYEHCTCSECGFENGENWMIGSNIKFCQECGAKMQEVGE